MKRGKLQMKKNSTDLKTSHVIIALMTLYIGFAFISAIVPYMNEQRANERIDAIVDKCRVRYMTLNPDGTQSFICESVYHDDAEMMIIHESESDDLKRNPYINRPVYIFDDGTVE